MKFERSLIALCTASLLTACGGSDDTTTTTTDLTGKAADGYLTGANVCLDINANKQCDDAEPSATSDSNGEFTLSGITQADIDSYPLLVEIVKNVTIDLDNPGVALTKSYTLSAPPGYTFVSPLTTMVQNQIENGNTEEQAKVIVKTALGTDLDLQSDYIAAKQDGQLSAEAKADFANLHQVAQVTARIIANNMDALEAVATESGIPVKNLVSLIVNEVFATLGNIVVQLEIIDADESKELNLDNLATEINKDIDLDTTTLAEKIEQNNAQLSAAKANLGALVQGDGMHWFSGKTEEMQESSVVELDYGSIKLNRDASITDIEYRLNETKDAFELSNNSEPEQREYVLTSNGWVVEDDRVNTITVNNDDSIILNTYTPYLSATLAGKEINLSGLSVLAMLKKSGGDGSWSKVITDSVTKFPAGSLGYQLSFTRNNAYTFSLGDWCKDDKDQIKWILLGGACNGVQHKYAGGEYQGRAYVASTLASLEVDSAFDVSDSWINFEATPVSGSFDAEFDIWAQYLTSGTVNFYKVPWNTAGITMLESGSWQDINVHGETLREISQPNSVARYPGLSWTDMQGKNGKGYYSVVDNFVRAISFDSDSENELMFNKIAGQHIVDNMDLSLLENVIK